ncbi:PilZ domain-containing protein [Halopseudomonas litoralis]|uniref:PilZ domain-containing protein n=1 Tax=Halopseudomonas litoralis TaxID=797277 RepID=A0A1H1N9D4_9GAMM|nr:PilZ domain-containing protein [Halopseudomonas litoralis]SDR95623.1 PilZ domain-containing protein [Halopseudomonas litoralis]
MQSMPYHGAKPEPFDQFSRRITRHQLPAYLNVYNSHTGRFMGTMGNVSCNGFMLISPLPVMLGAEYAMQLHLPSANGDQVQTLAFRAVSRWCRPDLTPGHHDAGFSIVDNMQVFANLADALQRYFTFVHATDA